VIDAKELDKALQGGGKLAESLDQFLITSYGDCVDIRYERCRYSAALARLFAAFPDIRKVSIARAPGRVNLIGEHTDYNGLPVLPMAIERDVTIIFSPRKDRRINLINKSFWFPPRSFDISNNIRPYGAGNWGNYAKAAAQALQQVASRPLLGMDACIVGDIPSDAGLSSSSALLVAVAMTIAATNGLSIERRDLAELLARGERYVGTEGGGMDQTVSLLAEPKKALKIDFFPTNATPVPVPEGYSFVVCNSLVAADKAGSACDAYNRRVIECRLGVAMLGKILQDRIGPGRELTMLGGMKYLKIKEESAALEQIPDGPIPFREVAKFIGMPASRLKENALKLTSGDYPKEPREGFKIKQRVRHVLSEGRRVEQAVQVLEKGNIEKFGRLMNESHDSCAKDYEISIPELDALAAICRDEGALGARLTGAGFGGCVIALVNDRDVPFFISSIVERYYHNYLPNERKGTPLSVMSLEDAIFPCKPCGGAATLL
jgi:N-acetylgalactosamine kinase